MSDAQSSITYAIGDSVRVKDGVMDTDDPELSLAGWQGRVIEVHPDNPSVILVEWDSLTLRDMPDSVFEDSEEEGLDWSTYYIPTTEVEPATPRVSNEDVKQIQGKLQMQYSWVGLGEEGPRIQKILAGVAPHATMAILQTWEQYLDKALTFPFDAEIVEFESFHAPSSEENVIVEKIVEVDERYGLIARIRHKGETSYGPLADLEARPEDSPNYQPLHDYCVWFANQ